MTQKVRTLHLTVSQSYQNCIHTHRQQVGNVGHQDRKRHDKPKTVHGRNN